METRERCQRFCLATEERALLAFRKMEKRMASGKVKWWDRKKGYGFITGEAGKDIFVHYTKIHGEGFKFLEPGEAVKYDLVQTTKGPKAENVEPHRSLLA